MNSKRFLAVTTLFLLGTLALLLVISEHRNQAPPVGKVSENVYAVLESPKRSLFGFDIPFLSDLFPKLSLPGQTTYMQNACLNGQNPSSMGTQEQLLQFIQGPCLPTILVPGLLASKLQVNIDCETLQSQNPAIFKSCGWDTCSKWDLFQKSPADSYTIWISDFIGPLSLILADTVDCWSNLIQLEVNSSATDLTTKYVSPAGADVIVKSSTIDKQGECGLSSEENMLLSPVQPGAAVGYENMKNALLGMGYQLGLTLYGAPYDWRKTTVSNGIGTILNNTVQQIYNLTGKPTVIVAHSLGNFGTLYLLNSLSPEQKEQYIANYVSLMNPLAGAPKSLLEYMGADTQYYFDNTFGVNLAAQKKLLAKNTGGIDVVPKDPFNYFANQQWMMDWQARIQLENEYDVTTQAGQDAWTDIVANSEYTYQWFPTPLQQCFEGFVNRSDQCGLYMYDWSVEPIVTIQGESFNASAAGIAELFDTYVEVTNIAPEMFADAATNGIYKLQNPEVPTTIIYASHLLTTKSFEWDYDPRSNIEDNNYALPTVTTYSQGDMTVPTTSSLLAALKWSWEFDNQVPNAKPVKTVEVCSIYNRKKSIYDATDSSEPYEVLNNEYIGIGCDCEPQGGNTTVGDDCDHADLPADSVLIQFIQNIVNANYNNTNYQQTGAYLLNDGQLNQIASSCPSVNYGPSVYFSILEDMSD